MKLYRFRYSPFARKVQMLLELLGRPHEVVEVPYTDRGELARLTGGYIYVPVLLDDDGTVTVQSRRIAALLLEGDGGRALVPAPLDGPIWAYADFCDGPLEDVLFRLASPGVRAAWSEPGAKALYTLIKERKFGVGCVDAWQASRPALLDEARELLAPTLRTLGALPFLFGERPTLADAALYGNLAMLEEAEPALPRELAPALEPYMRRVEAARPAAGSAARRT